MRAARTPGRWTLRLVSLVLAAFLAVAPGNARAQDSAPAEPAFSDAEIDALVRSLENPEERAKLIEQLKLLKAARAPEAPVPLVSTGLGAMLLTALSEQVSQMSRGFTAAGRVILEAPAALDDVVEEAGSPEARQRWLEIGVKLVIVLGIAYLARWSAELLLRRPSRALEMRSGDSLWVRIPMLVLRAAIEFLPVVAFAAAAYAVLPLTHPRHQTQLVALAIVNANVIAWAVRAVATLAVCPGAPALRLVRCSDETAHYVFIWVSRLTAVSVYGYFIAEALLLLGLAPAAHALLLKVIGLLVAAMLIVIILQNRVPVAEWLRGRSREDAVSTDTVAARPSGFGKLRQRIADVWHVLAILYVVASFAVWALEIPGGFQFLLRATLLSAVVLVLLRLVLGAVRAAVRRGFALSSELRTRFPGLEARANRYLPTLQALLQIVLYVVAAFWLLEIWGVDSFGWLESDFGRRLTSSIVTIAVIVVLAAVFLEIVDALIQRYLAPQDGLGRTVVRSARARTLLPLLRNAFRVLLAVMVTLTVLSELGINIAPLLAGAGVVGLAIGFGAQTLVKDVITGFFILAEDTVSIGDVIEIGGASGVVEAMTIRSIRLRGGDGSVHTIPFSAVTTVKNMTRDFSYAKFDISVSYDSDIDEVIAVMRDVADGMRADEQFRDVILSDLDVWGLDKFSDSALVVSARMQTAAGKNWPVMREFNRRLKQKFDERNISMPFPQRTVHLVSEQPAAAKTDVQARAPHDEADAEPEPLAPEPGKA